MPSTKPIVVTYVTIKVGNRNLGLIFSERIKTSNDVEAALHKALHYVEANRSSFSVIRAKPNPKVAESNNVLSFVARQWAVQKRYDKAVDAYTRLAVQAAELHMTFLQMTCAIEIADGYYRQGNFNAIIKKMPPLLAEAQRVSGLDDYIARLYGLLGFAYANLGRLDEANEHLSKALPLALALHGPSDALIISLETSLAHVWIRKHQPTQGKQFAEKALTGSMEADGATRWAATLFGYLAAVFEELDQIAPLVFYNKVAMAHLAFAQQANNEMHIEDDTLTALAKVFGYALLVRDHIISTQDELEAILNAPNTPEDTPYNKGRAWMRGPEVELYARYGEVAAQLEKAGKSGTEAEKIAARRDFRVWLDSVQKTLEK